MKDKILIPNFVEDVELLLTFYCKSNQIKYKQGLNEIVAPFILLKSKTLLGMNKIYNLFSLFINRYFSNYYHESEFFTLQSSLGLIRLLLKYHCTQINKIFEISFISPEMYSTSWLLTIFAR